MFFFRYDDEQSTEGYLYLKGNKKKYWCVVKDDLFMFFNTKQVEHACTVTSYMNIILHVNT